MNKFRFLEWEVYRDVKKLVSLVLVITKELPREYRFEPGSQIIRSAFSVALNIAEGSGKTSDKELNRFLEIALGSAYETLAAIDILKENGFEKIEEALSSLAVSYKPTETFKEKEDLISKL